MDKDNKSNTRPNRLLSKWLKKKRQDSSSSSKPLKPDHSPIFAPLSYGQERLWFLQKIDPEDPFYHYADAFQFEGGLDPEILIQSIHLIIERHDILRANFQMRKEGLVHIIHPEARLEVFQEDLSKSPLTREGRLEEAQKLARIQAQKPFDLENAALTRLSLLRLSPQDFYAVLTQHHIITDKWSMRVFREELGQIYSSLKAGNKPQLSPLEYQYPDFSVRQKSQDISSASLDYWRDKLEGAPEHLALPYDYQRPSPFQHQGESISQILPESLSQDLLTLARVQNTTMFTLLLAAFKVLLYRYTQQDDILVGTPFSNRDRVELEKLIGFFNETLVIRSLLKKDSTFLEFLDLCKENIAQAFEHKDVPFERLIKELKLSRNLDQNPLFKVMFLYHQVPPHTKLGGNLDYQYEPFDLKVSKFDLTLYTQEESGQLRSILEYSTELFHPKTAQNLLNSWVSLLKGIVAKPEERIIQLPIIHSAQKTEVLAYSETPSTLVPQAQFIHHDWEEQATKNPDKIAVSDGERALSYQELNIQSSLFAQELLQQGFQNNQAVGLYLSNSLEMLIGIWAILKAGGAYVPLDADYPMERIAFIIEDLNLQWVLSLESLSPKLDKKELSIIHLDAPPSSLSQSSSTLKAEALSSEDFAYFIYTSGSTGKPKGVGISHENLMCSTQARWEYYPESPDSFLLMSSFAFDSSIAGIFWTLGKGGKLVIPPKRIEQDAEQWSKLIQAQSISHTLLLPSLYHALLQNSIPSYLESLKAVIVAGEACKAELIQLHHHLLDHVRLYNEYGPTETTVWASVFELKKEFKESQRVPIGRAIPGYETYVLDQNAQLCPPGVSGELYIGGKGLSKGYWNRPELNKERFISHPFKSEEKLYKTGDQVRYNAHGNLEFLGRVDNQIKLRGYRIEPDEIQKQLERFKGVQQAYIHFNDEEQLIAYWTGDKSFQSTQLLAYLKGNLPKYMLPHHFIWLEEFPKLPNGKIDAKALPSLQKEVGLKADNYQAPQSPKEKLLAKIWEEVLTTRPIGIQDNFFEIGGDSILSIQIVAKARQAGLMIRPKDIFEYQTIQELAQSSQLKSSSSVSSLLQGNSPLLPIQHWFFEEHQNAPQHWNQGFVYTLPQKLAQSVHSQALDHLIRQHDSLRFAFSFAENKWSAKYLSREELPKVFHAFDFQEYSMVEAQKKQKEAIQSLQSSLALEKGGLFQMAFFQHPPSEKDQVFLMAHHLVVDQVSWQIIFQDLVSIYDHLRINKPLELAPKMANYRDWANFLLKESTLFSWEKELDFWKEQKPKPEEQVDKFKQALPVPEGSIQFLELSLAPDLSHSLAKEALLPYQSKIEELLISSLLIALKDWQGIRDICLGIEHNGRSYPGPDISTTVGWFTSFYPLRFTSPEEEDLKEQINYVKDRLRQVPKQGLGYGILAYLNPKYFYLSEQKPEIIFNYLGKQRQMESETLGSPVFLREFARDPRSEKYSYLEINAYFEDEVLKVGSSYSQEHFSEEEIKSFQHHFEQALQGLIRHCLNQDAINLSPSDFLDSGLDQDDLDNLLGQID